MKFSCVGGVSNHLEGFRSKWAPYFKRILNESWNSRVLVDRVTNFNSLRRMEQNILIQSWYDLFLSRVFVDSVILSKALGRSEHHIQKESWINH